MLSWRAANIFKENIIMIKLDFKLDKENLPGLSEQNEEPKAKKHMKKSAMNRWEVLPIINFVNLVKLFKGG